MRKPALTPAGAAPALPPGTVALVRFSETTLSSWGFDRRQAEKLDARVVKEADAEGPGGQCLELAYEVKAPDGANSEVPGEVALESAPLTADLVVPVGKELQVQIRVKSSQVRKLRVFLRDASGENFNSAQLETGLEWRTLSFSLARDFWNHWEGNDNGVVDYPLQNFKIEPVFAGTGASERHPEKLWVDSIRVLVVDAR